MEGILFNIKRYAIHDGPGIRVTFFMKGCPLTCLWCHNPEGISPAIEHVERVDRIGEKEFRVVEQVGIKYTLEDLEVVVEKERVFLEESQGGVTFSGGEPLIQSDFVIESMRRFQDIGIHTCLDTSGHTDKSVLNRAISVTDLFLFDLKHLNSDLHKEYTGVPNGKLLSNFETIINSGKDTIIRIPIIPGYNDDQSHLEQVRNFMVLHKSGNIKRVDLLPYHKIGSSKYVRFGIDYKMDGVEQPSSSRMNELKRFFSEPGFKVKIGG